MKVHIVMKRDTPGLESYYPHKAFLDPEKAKALSKELTPSLPGRISYVKAIELVDGDERVSNSALKPEPPKSKVLAEKDGG